MHTHARTFGQISRDEAPAPQKLHERKNLEAKCREKNLTIRQTASSDPSRNNLHPTGLISRELAPTQWREFQPAASKLKATTTTEEAGNYKVRQASPPIKIHHHFEEITSAQIADQRGVSLFDRVVTLSAGT